MIITRSPLRISLGGGGTDLPSYYRRHGGFLIAGAIDKYIYMLTHTVFQRRFRLKYSEFEEVDRPEEIRHPILRESLCRHWSGSPLEIASVADIPAGTGLGSSGSFTVCLLKALNLAGRMSSTPEAIAEAACHIEIDVLQEPSGKQDQYVAAHGGICAYTFNADDTVDVEPLRLSTQTLEGMSDGFLLFFTGETRKATSPVSVNLIALPSRLSSTWRNRVGSPMRSMGTSGAISNTKERPFSSARATTISVTFSR